MRYSKKLLSKIIYLMVLITILMSLGIPLDYEQGILHSLASYNEDEYTEYIVKRVNSKKEQ